MSRVISNLARRRESRTEVTEVTEDRTLKAFRSFLLTTENNLTLALLPAEAADIKS
jgi:hypothetical protein